MSSLFFTYIPNPHTSTLSSSIFIKAGPWQLPHWVTEKEEGVEEKDSLPLFAMVHFANFMGSSTT